MLVDMKEHIKEQQAQSNRVREQATLDRKDAIREHGTLRLLNNQLQAQIAALQNPSMPKQSKSEPETRESSDIRTLDELIQRRIKEAKLQFDSRSTLSAVKISDSPLSEEIL